jgi:signal transduction histidine kinase
MFEVRAFTHAMSGLVLGSIWFSALVCMWATSLGLLITLIGLPLIWLTLTVAAGMARVEAALARGLLDARAVAPSHLRGRRLPHRSLWDAQLYLLARFGLGLACGVVLIGVVAAGLGLLAAPAWYWALPDQGIELGVLSVDTLPEAVLVMPAGAAALALGWWLTRMYGVAWRGLAERLLHAETGPEGAPVLITLRTTVLIAGGLFATCVLIWATTGRTSNWPLWVALGLCLPVGLHAARGRRLAIKALALGICLGAWALAGGGYFWPIWPALGIAISEIVHALVRAGARSQEPRMTELKQTRAEVVGAQEDELRRIERDLHDGAQARLVSLAMSLGLAESRLDEDPTRARELMAEAQDQARTALRELRDLARGIAPPVLQDRGLKAAIEALAVTVPIPVTVTGSTDRVPAAVERAGYFVAAEALANAVKHSGALEITVSVTITALDVEVEVRDDGRGGADPAGDGLAGLRRRVEAIDGRLFVESTAERGTIIRACLPSASS